MGSFEVSIGKMMPSSLSKLNESLKHVPQPIW